MTQNMHVRILKQEKIIWTFFPEFFFSCGSLFVILNLLYGGSDNVIVHFDLDQSIHHGVEAEHKFFILLPTSNQDIFWQPPKFFSIDGLFLLWRSALRQIEEEDARRCDNVVPHNAAHNTEIWK